MFSSKTMLFNQLCRRIYLSHNRLSVSTKSLPTLDNDNKKEPTYIKSGFITSIRLDSGEEISIMRPIHMESLFIPSDVLENFMKDLNVSHSDKFIPFDQKQYSEGPSGNTVHCLDPDPMTACVSLNHFTEPPALTLKQLFVVYSRLSKIRLTTLVVISTIAGTLMAPVSFDTSVFVLSSLGTFLTSMSANTFNQILEVPYDSQMMRTRNRPLVMGKLSPLHASIFGVLCASSGLGLLLACNSVTFGIGLTNLLLYAAVYTPLKRASISNTWLGSIVGALPPLIGWSAATGGIDGGGMLLASILFCWQFPHFMALSWNLRKDYSKAGYQMASMVSPNLCKASALRHSALITLICCAAPTVGLTDWCFVVESFPFNLAMCVLAYQFYSNATSSTSRRLFRYTLVYLPIILTLLILNKAQIGN